MGFLKLDRKIISSAIWDDGSPFDNAHAWMDLLLYMNYADDERMVRGNIVKVKRGAQLLSDNFLANRWHWSRNRVRRYIQMLENAKMIAVKRTPYGTYINVVNYRKYQDSWTTNGTADGTSDGTTGGTSDGTQLKNIRNKQSNNARARKRASQPPERDYDMDELERKLLATNQNV